MPALPPIDQDSAPAESANTGRLSGESQAAALVVCRFRAALDWMITHPEWEGAIALSLNALGIEGKRRGISFRRAALSLPLEQKFQAIRHAMKAETLAAIAPPTGQTLARLWGEPTYRANNARARLSAREWSNFSRRLLLRMSARYTEYKRAQSLLFVSYAHLCERIARGRCSQRAQREDAAQEGRIALLKAIDKIDPEKAFDSYAARWIDRRIQNLLMQEKIPVKAPINLVSAILRGQSKAAAESPREQTLLLNSLREGMVWLDAEPPHESRLDRALQTEELATPDNLAERSDNRRHLHEALDTLTEKQRQVITLRFGLAEQTSQFSLSEIAHMAGISRQQVFQREKRALKKLAVQLGHLKGEQSQFLAETDL